MANEIDETIPEKPSLRNVQTPLFGNPKDKQYKVLIIINDFIFFFCFISKSSSVFSVLYPLILKFVRLKAF